MSIFSFIFHKGNIEITIDINQEIHLSANFLIFQLHIPTLADGDQQALSESFTQKIFNNLQIIRPGLIRSV